MDTLDKLRILAEAARYDASCASSGGKRGRTEAGLGNVEGMGICHSFTPDGRCVSLLKVLLTNHCIYDCRYCVNRLSSNTPRARFTPDEVASLTVSFYQRNYIEGLFLSSGIVGSPDETMEQLARVAELLRTKYDFHGYIHLKAAPGASAALLAKAGRYADRLSANIELPTQADLDALAPAKRIDETEATMASIAASIADHAAAPRPGTSFAPAGQSTQLIVGATPATDATLLHTADRLTRTHGLRRVYYTAYSPIPESPSGMPAAGPPLVREHRLYQADWLMRRYGFGVDEIVDEAAPQLRLDVDPKLAWALRNRAWFPVDVNTASRPRLLRVPGMGVRSVDRILETRRHRRLTLVDLARLRVALGRARPFVVTDDYNPGLRWLDRADLEEKVATQLPLFGRR
ncbi:MAG: putative DNA modification/repair radical SAM protein [Myxococcota bacterium]